VGAERHTPFSCLSGSSHGCYNLPQLTITLVDAPPHSCRLCPSRVFRRLPELSTFASKWVATDGCFMHLPPGVHQARTGSSTVCLVFDYWCTRFAEHAHAYAS
jgi:hypothetical protein